MKLHNSVLTLLAACTATVTYTATAAETVWDYTENTTFNYTEGNTPNIPESGDIRKTGAGTVFLKLDSTINPATDATIGGTQSDFAGNVYIDAGSIYLGTNSTGSLQKNYCISPDALGSKGTIHVASDAKLGLGISQGQDWWGGIADPTAINKEVSLNGGELYFDDGRYSFTKALQVTADSTINSRWSGKTQVFAGINASGKTLTFKGESSTYTINGSTSVGSIAIEGTQTLIFNIKDGETLSVNNTSGKLEASTINIEGGGQIVLLNGNASNNGGAVGKEGGYINISNASTKNVIIKAGYYGDNTRFLSDIVATDRSVLELQRASTDGSNTVTINGSISGDELTLVHTHGYYKLSATNTYKGGTIVRGYGNSNWGTHNALVAAAIGALGEGDVTLVGQGQLEVLTGMTQANTLNFNSDETSTTATLTGATWEAATLTGQSITDGTITGGTFDIKTAGLTFSNLTMTGASISLSDLGATTLSSDVASTILSGIALTGSLDLSLSSELITTYASETPFSITFTGLNSTAATGITVSQEMLDSFGAMTVTQGADTVLSFAGTGSAAVPEPTTATLSLLALAGLCARRRRK